MHRVVKKRLVKRIATERVDILYHLAWRMVLTEDYELANRYVELILKIAKKHKIRLPRQLKYNICKKCHTFLIPGKNAQVRLKKGKIIIKCENCGSYKRYPIK